MTVALCSAKGAQIRVGVPSVATLKSRSRAVFSSNATRCGVCHAGSSAAHASSFPSDRSESRSATSAAVSLKDAAAMAGAMNASRAKSDARD